jgi:adenylate kinase
MYFVMLGPPGAGKGTQARKLAEELGLAHISSGDLFRENMKNQTQLGKLAEGYIQKGQLVPDDVTIAMVRERIEQVDANQGAIFDGFPRTADQARALEKMLGDLGAQIKAVPYIRVPDDVLIERLTGRWTCRAKGHIFHEQYNPPKEPGRCDFDGSELYQREDDKVETVTKRIQVYHDQTLPLIDYYKERGLLVEVNGTQPIEEVTQELIHALKAKG